MAGRRPPPPARATVRWFACLVACCGGGAAAAGTTLSYRVHVPADPGRAVQVEVEAAGLDPAEPAIEFAMTHHAFTRPARPLVDNLRVAAAGAEPHAEPHAEPSLETGADPYRFTVRTAGAAALRLSYEVPHHHRELPDVIRDRDQYEHPYLAGDHAFLVTATLFFAPAGAEPDAIRVRFELPDGWGLVAPWTEIPGGEPRVREFDPGSRAALLGGLVAAGAFRIHEAAVGDFTCTVALAPGLEVFDEAAVDTILRIVPYQLELFDRPPRGRYLFVFGRSDGPGLGGSPKHAAMTLKVDPADPAGSAAHLSHLVAHEFFHTWSMAIELPGELRFVNEGFTDYFAYLTVFRLGLMSDAEFATALAERMAYCAASPAAASSLEAAGGESFFSDPRAYQLIYQGGFLLAAWLDLAIRAAGEGFELIDLMRELVNDAAGPTDLERLTGLAEAYAGAGHAAALRAYATAPFAEFDAAAAFGALGLEVAARSGPAPLDLRANFSGTEVLQIDPLGLGHRLGLRAGDRLVRVNGAEVTAESEVRARFREPLDGRIHLSLLRDGAAHEIDAEIPELRTFTVAPRAW